VCRARHKQQRKGRHTTKHNSFNRLLFPKSGDWDWGFLMQPLLTRTWDPHSRIQARGHALRGRCTCRGNNIRREPEIGVVCCLATQGWSLCKQRSHGRCDFHHVTSRSAHTNTHTQPQPVNRLQQAALRGETSEPYLLAKDNTAFRAVRPGFRSVMEVTTSVGT
jgi:hypothetical protein